MELEKRVETERRVKNDVLPFGIRYAEAPQPVGYKSQDIFNYTSVTFCTWKFIPLIDDGD